MNAMPTSAPVCRPHATETTRVLLFCASLRFRSLPRLTPNNKRYAFCEMGGYECPGRVREQKGR